jgi:hypothetical protein
MQHDEPPFTDDSGDFVETRSLWESQWLWLALGLVAVVALEAGVPPAIAAVLLCVKAGGRDMANGIWLWRRDPRTTNGAVIGLIYMSYAGWRIVFSSVLLAVVLAFATPSLEHWLRQNGWRIPAAQGDFQNVMQALGITCGSMLLASSLVSAVLTLAAGFLRVPVWLSSRVTSWRKRDEFPPFPDGGNSAETYINYSLLVIGLFALILFAVIGAVVAQEIGVAIGLLVAPILMFVLRDWFYVVALAGSPAACWDFAENPSSRIESGDDLLE